MFRFSTQISKLSFTCFFRVESRSFSKTKIVFEEIKPLHNTFRNNKQTIDKKKSKKSKNNDDETRLLQSQINKIQDTESILSFYQNNKTKMDLINICTCLDKIVSSKAKELKLNETLQSIVKKPEVKEMLKYLSENIRKMNEFALSNFIYNLAKLGIKDKDIINQLIYKILENQKDFSEKSLSYIVWALAKLQIKNEAILDQTAKKVMVKI